MKEEDNIYDLEQTPESSEPLNLTPPSEPAELSEPCEIAPPSEPTELSESGEIAESRIDSDSTEVPEEPSVDVTNTEEPPEELQELSPAQTELQQMISEMGAETILGIIKDNRNAAIRRIIQEVQDAYDSSIPSGVSSTPSCSSIFDLAALA